VEQAPLYESVEIPGHRARVPQGKNPGWQLALESKRLPADAVFANGFEG